MPASISVTRLRSFLNDADGDNVADPLDTFSHTIIIANGAGEDALNVLDTETENGLTIDPGSVNIGPIAVDNTINGVVGNTPYNILASTLTANDIDPDDTVTPNLTISAINGTSVVDVNGDPVSVTVLVTNGTVTSELDGSFTFRPTVGFEGAASFTYEVTDEDGVTSVAATPGNVTVNVVDAVWYVDADAAGGGNGTYESPFNSLTPLVNGGTSDLLDDMGDTIFVYQSTNSLAGGLQLEEGQVLRGEGTSTAFTANGITITAGGVDSVINHGAFGIELGQNNTILGVDFVGSDASGVAIRDNGSTAGNLTISQTEVSGTGQIIDVDNGGSLTVTFESLASSQSTGSVTGSGAIDLNGVQGSFTVTGATDLTGGSHSGGGIDITNSSNTLTTNFAAVTVNSGVGDAINYTGNSSGSVLTITGAVDLDTTSGVGLDITNNNSGTINITGGAMDIDTGAGTGINSSNVVLNITGANNDVSSTNGGTLLNMSGGSVGTSGVSFDTLSTGAATTVGAIIIDNLDGGTFHANTINITGTLAGDGINISNGSAATFDLDNVGVSNSFQDGIELNGANGVVDIDSISLQNTGTGGAGGQGLEIVGATQLVDIDAGAIGSTNDPSLEAVLITNGTGQVDINASITKTTSGNIVEVQGHSVGNISFTGNISATDGNGPVTGEDNGILLNNNASGTIAFSGVTKTLNTGTFHAVNITNNGANIDFTGGNLDIDVTSGTGIRAGDFATGTGGTLTVSGSNNTVTATTGTAVLLHGTDSDGMTFLNVAKNGGTATGVFIKDAGTGGFTVTGTGTTANSGGIIQNVGDGGAHGSTSAGIGVYVQNSGGISLSNMTIGNGTTIGNYGIKGVDVVNFTLRDSALNGVFGNDDNVDNEGTISFTDLTGLGLFEGNNVSGGFVNNMQVINDNNGTTLHLFIRDTAGGDQAVFGSTGTNNEASDALNVQARNDSNINMLVDGVQFTAWRGDGIQASAFDTGNLEATVRNSSFNNAHSNIASAGGIGVLIGGTAGGGTWGVDYTIEDNSFTGSKGPAIAASFNGFSGLARGFIDENTIGTNGGGYNGGGSSEAGGIFVRVERSGVGAGTLTQYATISDNTIRDVNKYGIFVSAANGDSLANNAILEATINNNTVTEMGGASSFAGLLMTAGGNDPDFGQVGADINNNTFNIQNTTNAYAPVYFDQIAGTSSKFYMPGYNGQDGEFYGGTGTDASEAYLLGRGNTLVNDDAPLTGDVTKLTWAPDARMDPGTLQTAQTGSNTQLPTGAIQLTPAPVSTPDEPAAPYVDPTPQTPPADSGGGTGGTGTGGGDPAPTPPADPAPAAGGALLTQAALDSMVDAAIERWAEAGATAGQLAAMRATAFSVSDMSGLFLGTSSSGTVRIDSDAAGRGWFIDSTPGEDGEFGGSGSRLTADAGGDAAGRMDLLTVVMHELGHQIGLVDDYNANQSDELMYGYANLGERRLAQADDLVGADLGHAGHEAFVLSPPVIPLLPQNKSVKIEFTSTVNDLNNGIFNNTYTNSSTVTGSNFTTAVANEDLVVDSLTLGDRVYVDANNNNTFDAGEGVSGVALTLFADDGDTAGVLDDNDTELTTGATGADGLYSFVNLSPGDFIVRVDAENFAAGTGALDGRITGNGAADPDTVSATMDGDDNGILQVDGSVASQAITLDYDTEPTSDGGIVPKNDVNNTLDFGFLLPNQAPVITSPATASGDEDTRIAVTGVSIADADAGTDALIVTLTVAAGALDITTATGLTVDSSVAGTLVLTGNLTDLNNGLATLGYTPVADYNGGPVTLTINANDQGNNGPDPGVGDPNSEEDETTVAITVNAVADIDNDTFNLTEDAGATTLTVLANDSFEGSGRAITDVGTALHGTVVIDDNDTIGNLTDDFIVYTPDADYNGSDSFTYEVTSGGVTETATVTVNLAPAVDVVTDAVNVDEDSSANLLDLLGNDTFADSGASITDASDPTNGSVTIDDKGTLDTTDDVVLYTPDAGYVGADSFTYEVTAGGVTETGTVNVTVGPINDAPTSTNLSGDSVTWNEGDSTTLLDFGSDATLDDVDSSDFQGGTLTVSIGTGKVAGEDQLSLTNSGTVTVASGVVSVGGNPVGNVSGGGAGGGNLVIAFNTAFATPTAVAAVISAVAYSNSGGDNPTDGDRTINWTIVDGDGNAGAAEDTLSVSSLVDVDPSNDAPFFQGSDTGPGSTLAYTENDPASALAPTAVLTDADSPDFGGGSLKVSLQANGESADELGILAVGGITLSGSDVLYNLTDIGDWSGGGAGGGDLQIDLDSDATVAAVDALIQAISYRNVSNNPGTLPRTVNFEVKDGDGGTSQANATVNFTAADDPASPVNDSATTKESDTVNIDVVFNDTDVDGPTPLAVTKIGTEDIATGETVTLTSGAKVTLNADGTLTYDPFGQFNDLAKFGSGASNTTDSDSFSYTLGNGGTGTVNVTIEGEYSVIHLLLGTNGADTINGTLGQDVFQPGTGADSMTGFSDDDVYTVDNVGDQPIEAFGQGTDTVLTSLANYSLHKHIENLVLLTGAVNGIGNQLENGIIGNDEANLLNGLGGADAMAGEGGDDTYIVQNSGDEVIETSALDGTDTVYSSAGAFTLGDFVENLHLVGAGLKGTGNGLDNLITGSSRGNTIDGKAGADTMAGNQGDDTYIVDNVGDQVIELGDGGTDTVKSSVSFRLGDGVNHLELTGTAANGTGNNLANIITGNGSANILKGANGNDKLLGGGDNDSLYGGAGNDVLRGDGGADGFYFDASINTPNVDSIVDFTVADDTIFLSKSYFKGIATGTLSAAAFHTGAAAADSSDRIVYDSATGNLFYDSDGTGADAQVLFATLDTGLALTNADFVLFI